MTETTMAVFRVEMSHLKIAMERLEQQAEARHKTQEESMRKIVAELASLHLEIEERKGFVNGIRFSFAILWAMIGAVITTIITRIIGQ